MNHISFHRFTGVSYQTYRVRFPVNARANRLPSSGASFEVPESLCQLKGLNDDALLLFIVAQLSVAGQREILAERVSIETVVRHNTTQIRVAAEEDTKQVVDLTLVPQSSFVQTRHTGHGAGLVRIGLNTDTGVIADAQQVVDDLEALVTSGEINRGNIGDLGEFGCRVVFQEAHDRDDAGGRNVDRELVLPHRELLNVFGQAGHDILAVLVQALGLVLVLVGGVDDRRAKSSLGYTQSQSLKAQPHFLIHCIRGRCAWRIFSGSGTLEASCTVDEKARHVWDDLTADASERPVLNRIKERAEAMMEGQWRILRRRLRRWRGGSSNRRHPQGAGRRGLRGCREPGSHVQADINH